MLSVLTTQRSASAIAAAASGAARKGVCISAWGSSSIASRTSSPLMAWT